LNAIEERRIEIVTKLADAHNLQDSEVAALNDELGQLNIEALGIEQSMTGMTDAVDDNTGALDENKTWQEKLIDAIDKLNIALDKLGGGKNSTYDRVGKSSDKLVKNSLEPTERTFGRLTTAVSGYSRALLTIPKAIHTSVTTSGGTSQGGQAMGAIIAEGHETGNKPMANAIGNVFDKGLITQKTAFRFGNNRLGTMGEAGPEAIMPLKRGRDGKLGVAGGGSNSITVNVEGSIITQEELVDFLEVELERRGTLSHGL